MSQQDRQMPPRTTMRDVARLAGVGTKTVSRVLNGEPNVSPHMIERVTRAAQSLNYQLNTYAGSLRRVDGLTRTLGLVVSSVDNPYAAKLHRTVEESLVAHGVAVFASSTSEDPEREASIVEGFLRRRVDGLIIMTTRASQSHLFAEIERGTPIVFVDRAVDGLGVDSVVSTNYSGAADAARHLLSFGHRRLAILRDDDRIHTARERQRGFTDELRRADEAPAIDVDGLRNEEEARAATHRVLESPQPPTAIFASQNIIAIGAFRALRERGEHHSVALLGFDEIELGDLLDPGISVVVQHPQRIGELAVERIRARMEGAAISPEQLEVPTTLIPRGSGEIRPKLP